MYVVTNVPEERIASIFGVGRRQQRRCPTLKMEAIRS